MEEHLDLDKVNTQYARRKLHHSIVEYSLLEEQVKSKGFKSKNQGESLLDCPV